ncbi:hypothetical protein EC973_006842 [Apophysomyces ossiformis]|uniref:Uncharacterized protein n=1 Tax=Apophysomyces ossiformis TaxID=679940 RepID=A0A8H7ERD3_9FUNG|nr:hypothetical protein EC973_006842 [Apophysomyces ossiformis]
MSNGTLDHDRISYLCEESLRLLVETIGQVKQQILQSAIYLNDPQANQHLYDQTFCPDLHHVVKQQRLFNLVAKPSFTKKYIQLSNNDMNTLVRAVGLYAHGNDTLISLLDLTKVKQQPGDGSNDVYRDEADLESEDDQDIPDKDLVELPEPEVVVGENDDIEFEQLQIRQISTAEYYTRAGFKKTTQRINTSKTPLIRRLESEIDTNRTADMDRIIRSIVSTLDALPEVTDFYG